MLRQFTHDRGFEARVHGAVAAERILPRFPVVPIRSVPEVVERFGVCLADQITRTFPPSWREGDRAPWRAVVVAHAGRELEEHRRRGQAVFPRDLEHAPELFLNF